MWLLSVFFQQLMEDKRDLAWQLREVKRMLRGVMSGPVSASMREQGLAYKVNFGVDQPRLRESKRQRGIAGSDIHRPGGQKLPV